MCWDLGCTLPRERRGDWVWPHRFQLPFQFPRRWALGLLNRQEGCSRDAIFEQSSPLEGRGGPGHPSPEKPCRMQALRTQGCRECTLPETIRLSAQRCAWVWPAAREGV